MAFRQLPRSTISGSWAAPLMVVSPSAKAAAIIRFSVPPTVAMSNSMRAPLSPLGAFACT